MTEHFHPRTEIVHDEDGRRVASADIKVVAEAARASLSVEAGYVPAGTREHLVDVVLDSPEVNASHHLEVAIPLGDADMLHRIRERCDTAETRAAGSSCLINADPPHPSATPDHNKDDEAT